MSIAPTGSISNIILSYQNGDNNYLGVSGGVEPILQHILRRTESFGKENDFYKNFIQLFKHILILMICRKKWINQIMLMKFYQIF